VQNVYHESVVCNMYIMEQGVEEFDSVKSGPNGEIIG
jgi:hypothetical protein